MWIAIGIISAVILVLVLWRLVNSRPKAMNAGERIGRTRGEAEIVGGPANPTEPRRKRTVEEIKKDILRQQELEEARKEQ